MGHNAYIIFKTKPFEGWRMKSPEFKGKVAVAIPEKKMKEALENKKILAVFAKGDPEGCYMEFKGSEIPIEIGEFEDKWGREGRYRLFYYLWSPKLQFSMF